ncbi:MAG TPA: hypothetical protein VMD51_15800 [Mycobacterium sp.]|nr:hypothetical protein [Mycobacterium sp.]
MNIYTADFGVAGMAHHPLTLHAFEAAPAAATAQRKRRAATAAPTFAFVDRSFT